MKIVSLGVKRHTEVMAKRIDPRGRPYYWSGFDPLKNHQTDPGTDVRELADGYATLTPLDFDLTHPGDVESFRGQSWSLPAID